MSYCKKEGKDKIIFATEEDHSVPSKVPFPEEDEEDKPVGLLLPNGDINWGCPCLGGMATGPCGVEFREAFTCFHYSKAEPKGRDCLEVFKTMSSCMSNYPGVYGGTDPSVVDEDEAFIDDTLESRNGSGNIRGSDSGNDSSNTSLDKSSKESNTNSKSS